MAVHLLSFYKPFLVVGTVLPYAWIISSVIDKDVRWYHLNAKAWSAICTAGLVIGIAFALLIPIFWVGWPLMILLYAGIPYAYWKYRDPKVPQAKRFDLFAGKWAAYSANRAKTKAFGVVTASYADSKGNRQTPPTKEEPLFEIHLATEQLILSALPARATRIDLVPTAGGYASSQLIDSIRYKRDGFAPEMAVRMIDYLKSAAALDTKDRRKKVRAAMRMDVGGGKVNLLLTSWGTSAGQFLRLDIERDKQLAISCDSLGMLPSQLELLKNSLTTDRDGVILVAAAPGNGLTISGYSLLSRHDPYNNNIKTLERFVERKLDGVDHVEWDPSDPSADFASSLQTVVRRGPDIVLASDITDSGTGKVLVNQNNFGTLFYVLVPTDSVQVAIGAYLKAVGDNKAAAARLRMVVCSRLIRTLCPECRQPYQATPEQAKRLGGAAGKPMELFRASGKVQVKNQVVDCAACQGSGFQGLTGLFEVVALDDRAREILATGDIPAAYAQMKRACRAPSQQDCGLVKAKAGETSLEEVARVFAPKAPPKSASAAPAPSANKATAPKSSITPKAPTKPA